MGLMAEEVMYMELVEPSRVDWNGWSLWESCEKEVLKGRVAPVYGCPQCQPEKMELYQDNHFQLLFTSRIFFSHFYNKTPVYTKEKNGVALVDRNAGFPPSLGILSPINIMFGPQQNSWSFMKQGLKISVLQIRLVPSCAGE